MVQRNLTLNHEFVCFTEDATGIDPHIRIEPLDAIKGIEGWWYKPMFFNPNFPLKGTILFLDLDLIIFRNIDCLFTHEPDKFLIIRDFNRCRLKGYKNFNSSVFRLTTGQHPQVYTAFLKDPAGNSKRYRGDQEWIFAQVKSKFEYWPEEWIQSYKWEMRGNPKLQDRHRTDRDFVNNGDPTILPDTSVAVFHGDPNPHNCKDSWVKQNWG